MKKDLYMKVMQARMNRTNHPEANELNQALASGDEKNVQRIASEAILRDLRDTGNWMAAFGKEPNETDMELHGALRKAFMEDDDFGGLLVQLMDRLNPIAEKHGMDTLPMPVAMWFLIVGTMDLGLAMHKGVAEFVKSSEGASKEELDNIASSLMADAFAWVTTSLVASDFDHTKVAAGIIVNEADEQLDFHLSTKH